MQRSYWETVAELKLKWLMLWHRVARESAARKERPRQKRSQERRDKKDRKHIAKAAEALKGELNECEAASNQNDPAPKAQDVTDGVVVADGVADGAVEPESLEKSADRTVAEHTSRS